MESEWRAYLRHNAPELFKVMRDDIKHDMTWRDERIEDLEAIIHVYEEMFENRIDVHRVSHGFLYCIPGERRHKGPFPTMKEAALAAYINLAHNEVQEAGHVDK